MSRYASHFSTRVTAQNEIIPGKAMVSNNAGGFVFQIDKWKQLERFLILGSEKGTYYVSEHKLTVENAQCVLECIKEDPKRTVSRIVDISDAGRAPKNSPAIFALAIAASQKESAAYALGALSSVCRIPTHLFEFLECVQNLRGWGRSLRRAVGNWYLGMPPKTLAKMLTKYQQRNGWSNRDALRLSHPKTMLPQIAWAVGKMKSSMTAEQLQDMEPIFAFEEAQKAESPKQVCELILKHGLPRECIPTKFLNDPEVWKALLVDMPMTAMVRNLATMTRNGAIAPLSPEVDAVCQKLEDANEIRKSRIHPIAVLLAAKTYASGRGDRSQNTWTPIPRIVDALDKAFYLAFENVEPTGKRFLLALDVSGSMEGSRVAGTNLTAREAAGALAMMIARTERSHHIVGFSCVGSQSARWEEENKLVPVPISSGMRLKDACDVMAAIPMGGTDCALPMIYATENKLNVDVFVVVTDNETWHGKIHPCQALQEYRRKTGIPAKLCVLATSASSFSIADPSDAGSLDCCGFDASVPAVIADFAKS